MNKTQKYLLAALAGQFILILVVFLLQKPVTARNNLIFTDLSPESVSVILISDSTGKSVSIEKQGTNWVLPNQDNFPVPAESVQQLIEKLATIRDNRLVTQSETSHERLRISDQNFERKIELTINGKKEVVYFGSSPVTSNIHFRLDGRPEVYLTNAITSSQLSPEISGWVDTILFQISGNTVSKIEVSNKAGRFAFTPDSESNWTTEQIKEGTQFDQSKWSSLLSGFTNLRFTEPVTRSEKNEFGLNDPLAEMVIEYKNDAGETTTGHLVIGNQDLAGNYYAKWNGSDYIYLISSFNAERFINLTPDDYSSPISTETTEGN